MDGGSGGRYIEGPDTLSSIGQSVGDGLRIGPMLTGRKSDGTMHARQRRVHGLARNRVSVEVIAMPICSPDGDYQVRGT